jgi:hypothetical protein
MPKSIKDLFEVYRPKAKDEADFVDKHVTIKHKDRNGNGDDVFKGNTKYIKRKEERKGYDVGEDEKVYEDLRDQVLKSLVDAADELGEEFDEETLDAIAEEVLDELSKDTLGSYVKKAKNQLSSSDYHVGRAVGAREAGQSANFSKELELKHAARGKKRYHGIDKAINKMTKEELEIGEEALDELSKSTVGRYINKAKDSIDMTSYRSGIKDGTAISRNDPYTSNNPLEKKLSKRHKGIETAVKKLTKEEILNNFIDMLHFLGISGQAEKSRRHRHRIVCVTAMGGEVFQHFLGLDATFQDGVEQIPQTIHCQIGIFGVVYFEFVLRSVP